MLKSWEKERTKVKLRQRCSHLKTLQLSKINAHKKWRINIFIDRKFWKIPPLVIDGPVQKRLIKTITDHWHRFHHCVFCPAVKLQHEMEKVLSGEFRFFLQLGAFLVPTTVTWRFLPPVSNGTAASLLSTFMEHQLWNKWFHWITINLIRLLGSAN